MPELSKRLDEARTMATREYIIRGEPELRKITVRIGFPTKRENDDRYECIVDISEGGHTNVKPMNGVDAFEALQLALIMIGTIICSIRDNSDGSLTWFDGRRSDIGFPTFPDFSMRPIMDPPLES